MCLHRHYIVGAINAIWKYVMSITGRSCIGVLLLSLASMAFAGTVPACPSAPQQPTPEMVQAGMREARDHGFLWRISKDGRSSYLYGTIHVARAEWMYPGPRVMQAIRATDSLALELDMLDGGIQQRMAKGMAQLHTIAMPEPLAKRLRRQADAVCVPYDRLSRLAPEMQIVSLTLMIARREGLDAAYGIDAVLAGMGHGAKKTTMSLETPEEQLALLQMKDEQEAVTFVSDSLDELEAGRSGRLLGRIARAWSEADYAEMGRYSEWCDCLKTPGERQMMKRVLDDRNPKLATRIDEIHSNGKQVFAAVGSLHMFGESGLPALMAGRGYRVERVELNVR
jgi:uncharacterized protein YbaP (TraB family)